MLASTELGRLKRLTLPVRRPVHRSLEAKAEVPKGVGGSYDGVLVREEKERAECTRLEGYLPPFLPTIVWGVRGGAGGRFAVYGD